jgi:hypothetical protein
MKKCAATTGLRSESITQRTALYSGAVVTNWAFIKSPNSHDMFGADRCPVGAAKRHGGDVCVEEAMEKLSERVTTWSDPSRLALPSVRCKWWKPTNGRIETAAVANLAVSERCNLKM